MEWCATGRMWAQAHPACPRGGKIMFVEPRSGVDAAQNDHQQGFAVTLVGASGWYGVDPRVSRRAGRQFPSRGTMPVSAGRATGNSAPSWEWIDTARWSSAFRLKSHGAKDSGRLEFSLQAEIARGERFRLKPELQQSRLPPAGLPDDPWPRVEMRATEAGDPGAQTLRHFSRSLGV
jgi:hypothetical protein